MGQGFSAAVLDDGSVAFDVGPGAWNAGGLGRALDDAGAGVGDDSGEGRRELVLWADIRWPYWVQWGLVRGGPPGREVIDHVVGRG